jgi:hypothetical protein
MTIAPDRRAPGIFRLDLGRGWNRFGGRFRPRLRASPFRGG